MAEPAAIHDDGVLSGYEIDASPITAVRCVSYFLKQRGLESDRETIVRMIGGMEPPSLPALVASVSGLKIEFEIFELRAQQLLTLREPVITQLANGLFAVILSASEDTLTVYGLQPNAIDRVPFATLADMWTGTAARCLAVESGQARKIGISTFRRHVSRLGFTYSSLAIASILVGAIELSIPFTFLVIIDSVVVNRAAATLDVVILIFVVLIVFGGVLSQLSDRLRASVGKQLDSELVSVFTRHLLSLPISFLRGIRGSEVLSRINELSPVHRTVSDVVAVVWVDILFLLVCVSIGFYFSSVIALIMMARLVLYLIGALRAVTKLRQTLQRSVRVRREGSQLVLDTMDGIETVKSRHAEGFVGRQIETRLRESAELSDSGTDFRSLIERYTSIVDRMSVGVILWVGAHQVINGGMTAGQIMAVYLISRLMMKPLNRLARVLYDCQRIRIGLGEVNHLLGKEPEAASRHLVRPHDLWGHIRFENAKFRYTSSGPDVLQNITFEVRPGEVIGIVGPSGSGKSTILRLVQRLYLPSAGRITIDDNDIEILHPHWLRERIGYVAQDCWILGQSIGENIRLGSPLVSRHDVIEAARIACAHEFIVKMPKGYDTVIQGTGSLSGGERQRIAIARAIVHKPKLLLFDESTSALDHETESMVLKNLEQLLGERTVLIVAHRISALRSVHRIVALDAGKIEEIGTPAELIVSGGYFARMLGNQFDMLSSFAKTRDSAGHEVRGDPSEFNAMSGEDMSTLPKV